MAMTNEQVVGVCLRVFGAWLVYHAALALLFFGSVAYASPTLPMIVALTMHVVWCGLGVALIVRPLFFAHAILPSGSSTAAASSWSLEQFQAVLFSLLGTYITVLNFTNLPGLINFWRSLENAPSIAKSSPQDLVPLASEVLRMAVGIWLMFGANGLIGFIRRVRRA